MSLRDINWIVGPIWGVLMGAALIIFCRPIARFFTETQSGIRIEARLRSHSERSTYLRHVCLLVAVGAVIATTSALVLGGILGPT
jgi:Na+-driven multidrug efflux pump